MIKHRCNLLTSISTQPQPPVYASICYINRLRPSICVSLWLYCAALKMSNLHHYCHESLRESTWTRAGTVGLTEDPQPSFFHRGAVAVCLWLMRLVVLHVFVCVCTLVIELFHSFATCCLQGSLPSNVLGLRRSSTCCRRWCTVTASVWWRRPCWSPALRLSRLQVHTYLTSSVWGGSLCEGVSVRNLIFLTRPESPAPTRCWLELALMRRIQIKPFQ